MDQNQFTSIRTELHNVVDLCKVVNDPAFLQ